MNQRRTLVRKLMYIFGIFALLVPLSWLSQPSVKDSEGRTIPGGMLAQKRDDYQLSQGSLGEIDPASETIKLATLGLRGIAANRLWEQANEYKKKEDWTGLSATLEQIAHLQPNVVSVWRFQAWNLSYNVAVEFDRYQDRYYWVMKGINFLQEGTRYNVNEPMLMWDLGWFIAQKIGRADERVQYRRLFLQNDDFHGDRRREDRDNWLVGRQYFLEAQKAADRKKHVLKILNPLIFDPEIKGVSPLLFPNEGPKCLISFAEAVEDGPSSLDPSGATFGEKAKIAWKRAGDAWRQYGDTDITSSFNVTIRLNEQEKMEAAAREANEELETLAPGIKQAIRDERIALLTENERAALEAPDRRRTAEQTEMMPTIDQKVTVTAADIAQRVEPERRAEALRVAEAATQAEFAAKVIEQYRDIVNFKYWRLRCQVEQDQDTLDARKLIYDAEKARRARLVPAQQLYEAGLKKWRKVLDAHPDFISDNTEIDELADSIDAYRELLLEDKKDLPQPFFLQDVLDAAPARSIPRPSATAKSAAEKKEEQKDDGEKTQEQK